MKKPDETSEVTRVGSNAGLGAVVKFKGFSSRVDRRMGVSPGMGLPIVGLALAVGLQWFFVLSQLFCPPCMQAIFAIFRLVERLLLGR